MQKRGISSSKKSSVESVWTVIGLVFVAGVLVLLTYAGFKVAGMFFGSETEKLTTDNFNALAMKINLLLSDKSKYNYTEMPFYIGDDYIIVGFDKEWNPQFARLETADELTNAKNVYKPSACFDKACICLFYKEFGETSETRDKGLKSCQLLEGNVKFISYWLLDKLNPGNFQGAYKKAFYYPNNVDYGNLVFYGYKFGTRQIYVEKFIDTESSLSGIPYIYIGCYNSKSDSDKNYQDILKRQNMLIYKSQKT